MPISSLRGKMLHHGRRLRNHTFPTPEQRTFCLHRGEDNLVPPGHSPRVTTASRARRAAISPMGLRGQGAGPETFLLPPQGRPASPLGTSHG